MLELRSSVGGRHPMLRRVTLPCQRPTIWSFLPKINPSGSLITTLRTVKSQRGKRTCGNPTFQPQDSSNRHPPRKNASPPGRPSAVILDREGQAGAVLRRRHHQDVRFGSDSALRRAREPVEGVQAARCVLLSPASVHEQQYSDRPVYDQAPFAPYH